jgi:hypothetical protein
MSNKGYFKPRNPDKYKGDPTNIIYRSLWELKLMGYLDSHEDVERWSSEEFFIPYRSPVDNRIHRYFPDFWVKKVNGEVMVLEVKPLAQSVPPQLQEKVTRKYVNQVMTYGVNQAKWKAAKEFCEDRKWQFKVLTEKELGIKF